MSLTYGLKALRNEVRLAVAARPALYMGLFDAVKRVQRARGQRYDQELLRRDTELVLEGFPRSANSFALQAFRFAQRRPRQVAHHTHAAATLIQGLRWKIPTVLLLRDPEGAVISLHQRTGQPLALALRSYIATHKPLLPLLDELVISDFKETTGDFGAVIDRTNARFGSDFDRFSGDEADTAAVFARIEDHNRFLHGKLDESKIGRPSAERDKSKATLLEAYRAPALAGTRDEAAGLYATIAAAAERQRNPGVRAQSS